MAKQIHIQVQAVLKRIVVLNHFLAFYFEKNCWKNCGVRISSLLLINLLKMLEVS